MKKQRVINAVLLTSLAVAVPGILLAGTSQIPTGFTNQGGIINTRHNLTQSTMADQGGGGALSMKSARNNYGQVCVYCHTPHGSSTDPIMQKAPLWNRTRKNNTYTTYGTLVGGSTYTLAGTEVTQPGVNSLTCLSCHDGTTAVDSVINMPSTGGYNAAQMTTQNDAFLDQWRNNPEMLVASRHQTLKFIDPTQPIAPVELSKACMSCHAVGMDPAALDFSSFAIGTDLRNDHPVGVKFPTVAPGVDFNDPNLKVAGKWAVFDANGNGRPESREIRMYDSGQGYEVECASCHDPHGVFEDTGGKAFPTFLRKSNSGSAVCLTCHAK